jgi:hypothetical protein
MSNDEDPTHVTSAVPNLIGSGCINAWLQAILHAGSKYFDCLRALLDASAVPNKPSQRVRALLALLNLYTDLKSRSTPLLDVSRKRQSYEEIREEFMNLKKKVDLFTTKVKGGLTVSKKDLTTLQPFYLWAVSGRYVKGSVCKTRLGKLYEYYYVLFVDACVEYAKSSENIFVPLPSVDPMPIKAPTDFDRNVEEFWSLLSHDNLGQFLHVCSEDMELVPFAIDNHRDIGVEDVHLCMKDNLLEDPTFCRHVPIDRTKMTVMQALNEKLGEIDVENLPKVLYISIKRDGKATPVDLNSLLENDARNKGSYKLAALVAHTGMKVMPGHERHGYEWVTYCKCTDSDDWTCYDGTTVPRRVTLQDIPSSAVVDFFYKRS